MAFVALLLFLTVPLALMLVALIDVLGHSEDDFSAIGHSRSVWMVSVVILLALGPILYLTLAKPKMRGQPNS